MRLIKFRAWDKERKEMREVQLMDWSDWWVSTGSTWERGNQLEYGERNSFKNEDTDRHILMQYTGLKDKSGKEIYEGDIAIITFVDGIKENFEVYYESNRARFSMRDKDKNDWGFAHTNEIEVIGNIYSNPELLEVTP